VRGVRLSAAFLGRCTLWQLKGKVGWRKESILHEGRKSHSLSLIEHEMCFLMYTFLGFFLDERG